MDESEANVMLRNEASLAKSVLNVSVPEILRLTPQDDKTCGVIHNIVTLVILISRQFVL